MAPSTNLRVHKKWSTLRADIQEKYEPQRIDKRIGMDKTIVFRIEELEYDPQIPKLDSKDLKQWLKNKNRPRKQQRLESSKVATSSSIPEKAPDLPARTLSSPASLPVEHACESVRSPALSEDFHSAEEHETIDIQSNSSESDAVCQGNIDRLQIKEQIGDEYQYDDDDEEVEETTLSRNLKKIRTEPDPNLNRTSTNATNSTSTVPQASTSSRSSNPFTTATSSATPLAQQRRPEENQQTKAPPPQPPKPPQIVNWPEIKRNLSKNLFHAVYRDLLHFKKDVSSDEGRQVLKEAIIKSIQEDETYFLCDFLKIVLELKYADDVNFWTELVLRFKRKLSTHAKVKTFKVKTDPELVYANYERAMLQVANHVAELNIALTLPYHTFVEIEQLRQGSLNLQNGQKCVEPKIKAEIKVEQRSQQSEQENNGPTTSRRVTATKTPEGKQIFEISVPRKVERVSNLRIRL